MAGSVPSTGLVQSNFGLRLGMKFEWKNAMLPSASAYRVLLDELVCRSITFLYSARLRALVREYDWFSAFNGSCIIRMLTHLPSTERTIGPRCVL